VEGRFLQAADVDGIHAEAVRAAADGAMAVFIREGALGDPIVLAAGLAPGVPDLLLGARIAWRDDGRHPAMLARDITSLDLVCGGRSVLCFAPPFTEPLAEAVSLCRALWQAGEVRSDGPHFPVRAAANRARPAGGRTPLIAFDLTDTDADVLPGAVAGSADLLLRPSPDGRDGRDGRDGPNVPDACLLEWV
jgi:alkanesulfonate monooxygenase SsuD/methylene tetrahydromethanopterin reductase-like flavin-dependent oxidoreductase (luciferase family)